MPKRFIAILSLCLSFVLLGNIYAEKKKIVLLAGPRSHKPGDHEFYAGCVILARALNEQSGLNVEAIVNKGWPTDNEAMLEDAAAVFIYCDSTKVLSPAKAWEKMDALTKKGVGIMFMHYAVHPDKTNGNKYYTPWIGGFMETHWSVNPHWVADLMGKEGHGVSNGITFPVRTLDEFYYNMRFNDVSKLGERLHLVKATPTAQNMVRIINLWNKNGLEGLNKPQTIMWGMQRKDANGKPAGRGVGFTGGHYHRNWAVDDFRKLVLNALVWTAGMDIPEGGVKSLPLTVEQLNENLDGKPKSPLTLPTIEEMNELISKENYTHEGIVKLTADREKNGFRRPGKKPQKKKKK